jgi:hypothetical protein
MFEHVAAWYCEQPKLCLPVYSDPERWACEKAMRALAGQLDGHGRVIYSEAMMNELKTLILAADSAADALSSRWWLLTRVALQAALWAAGRAERATGATLDDVIEVIEDVRAGYEL